MYKAIRTQIQRSKPKRQITYITSSHNTKRTYGQPSEQLLPKRWPLIKPPLYYISTSLIMSRSHGDVYLMNLIAEFENNSKMSLVVRKPAFCICENKDADSASLFSVHGKYIPSTS